MAQPRNGAAAHALAVPVEAVVTITFSRPEVEILRDLLFNAPLPAKNYGHAISAVKKIEAAAAPEVKAS